MSRTSPAFFTVNQLPDPMKAAKSIDPDLVSTTTSAPSDTDSKSSVAADVKSSPASYPPHTEVPLKSEVSNFNFSAIKGREQKLGSELKIKFDQNSLTEPVFQKVGEWLQLRTILNMQRVCIGFNTGSLFYREDPAHPESSTYTAGRPIQKQFTTSDFKPIHFVDHLDEKTAVLTEVEASYQLPAHKSASDALTKLLVSKTMFDCGGACQLAFYFTLLDLLKLFYGDEKGKKEFDSFFEEGENPLSKHAFNRLRIGLMGSAHAKKCDDDDSPDDYSAIYYMTQVLSGLSLEELQKDPEKFLGMQMYIGGYPRYFRKHPDSPTSGWNVIFIGLNPQKEPLFLIPRFLGQNYILTYSQVIKLMRNEFNLFPQLDLSNQANFVIHEKEMEGLLSYRILFDPKKIKSLLTSPSQFKQDLLNDGQDFFNKTTRPGNYSCISFKDAKAYKNGELHLVGTSYIKQSQDDMALYLKPNRPACMRFKTDFFNLQSKDDAYDFHEEPAKKRKDLGVNTCLMDRIRFFDTKVARRLIRSGKVKVTATDVNGDTALHHMAFCGSTAFTKDDLQLLLSAKADINAVNKKGETAVMRAKKGNNAPAIDFFSKLNGKTGNDGADEKPASNSSPSRNESSNDVAAVRTRLALLFRRFPT